MLALTLFACAEPPPGGDLFPTEGSLSALTYNVQGLPDVLTDHPRPGLDRMERIAPLLVDYDVVGLQEDFDAANHAALVARADHDLVTWFDDPVDDTRVYGPGLSLLTRAGQVVEVREEHYTTCHGVLDGASDCLASKGFHVVRLDLGGGVELDVLNTHHEAGGGTEDDLARAAQVAQVLAALEGPSAGRAILYMGDFNLRWTDPEDVDELQAYVDAGLRDACDEVACPELDHIDKFFLRDSQDLRLEVVEWRREAHFLDEDGADLSDHPAIAVEVAWTRLSD